jgi:hypothetical protein
VVVESLGEPRGLGNDQQSKGFRRNRRGKSSEPSLRSMASRSRSSGLVHLMVTPVLIGGSGLQPKNGIATR